MDFPLNVYAVAFTAAFAVSALSLPAWRSNCRRWGLIDDPGHRKIHDEPIPLAGGLAILSGLALPLLVAALLFLWGSTLVTRSLDVWTTSLFTYGFERRAVQLLVLVLAGAGMLLLGLWDDRHELKPASKFAGQTLLALAVAAAGVRITLFVEHPLFSYLVTVLWILTVTNACNFMDNMNGLCTGLGVIAGWCFAWAAAVEGQYLVGAMAFLGCGALLGFLPFNFPRASAFLGDAGSHLTGYLLAVLAILPSFYSRQHPEPFAVLKPLLVLAVVLGDLLWVVVLRARLGKPFYVGDTNHLSHRLVRRGLSRTTAVLLIWLLSALAGAASFLF